MVLAAKAADEFDALIDERRQGRTGSMVPGPEVVEIKPTRDRFGRVTEPARVWISATEAPRQAPTPAVFSLELPGALLQTLAADDSLRFRDARGARRTLTLTSVGADGCWAEATRSSCVTNTTGMKARRRGIAIAGKARVSGVRCHRLF